MIAASPVVDQARPYLATDGPKRPPDLSLEKLHLTFSENLYQANDSGGLFHWGVVWRRHVYYDSLDAGRAALSRERGSVVAPFFFRDYLTRDFRVPASSDALRLKCYPVGDVPDVRLGIAPTDAP